MKILFLIGLVLTGCTSVPIAQKNDCYSFDLHDLNTNLGRDTFELSVYDIRKYKDREYILFRDIDDNGFKKSVKINHKELESSGLVWIWSEDFYKMTKFKGGDTNKVSNYRSTGFSRFSYPEGTRNGVYCNPVR